VETGIAELRGFLGSIRIIDARSPAAGREGRRLDDCQHDRTNRSSPRSGASQNRHILGSGNSPNTMKFEEKLALATD